MILSFKKQFKQKILDGTKIHTIREDSSNRWWPGKHIHFATGVRTKNYDCFKEGRCMQVQEFEIKWHNAHALIPDVFVGGQYLTVPEIEKLAVNDGFDTIQDFYEWFNKDFHGKLIHWTDFKY